MYSRIYAADRAFSLHHFHTFSRSHVQALKQKTPPIPDVVQVQGRIPHQSAEATEKTHSNDATFAKRNEVGVQLLSRSLHSQIFKNVSFPSPHESYTQIAREHLSKHHLDPTTSSTHPDVAFTLPPLQGDTIDSHFHIIGARTAEPYLSMSKQLASSVLPSPPESWVIQSGWTKYWTGEDGLHESVESPNEQLLVFDVESMPKYHQFSVMACAASPTAWYAWISPWLLGETADPQQLIPLGDPSSPRIVVGHNVSYDRARTLEEYRLERPGTRWLDTMALHVAVNGISSHQRPAWSKYRKQKQASRTMKDEAVASVCGLIMELKREANETDGEEKAELLRRVSEMQESLPSLQAIPEVGGDREGGAETEEMAQQRWEELTSANSLADVARLHCGIEVDKATRDDFMISTPDAILADVSTYLTYCANDVAVTHEVFRKTLPAFFEKCPSPVSFSGVCSMGSSFLTVNESWERYLENAESKYQELEGKVVAALKDLAKEAQLLLAGNKWKGDVWLEQLDWTPKKPRKAMEQNVELYESLPEPMPMPPQGTFDDHSRRKPRIVPKFYNDMLVLGVMDPYVLQNIIPYVLRLQLRGEPVRYTHALGWYTLSDAEDGVPLADRIVLPAKKKIMDLFDRTKSFSLYKMGILGRQNGESMNTWVSLLLHAEDNHTSKLLLRIARRMVKLYDDPVTSQERQAFWPWMTQLDWTPVQQGPTEQVDGLTEKQIPENSTKTTMVPKWYWQLGKPKMETNGANLDITVRNRVAPILLKLKWQGWPLVYSREHGWTFRVAREALKNGGFTTRQKELSFYHDADEALRAISCDEGEFAFFKLPHKDGEAANVGSPLGKTFLKFAADGTLSSPGETAKEALGTNAQCSYWISARDRIMKQMVVWDSDGRQGLRSLMSERKWGMILPQVITMGTVTRRAIEKTWLTASNAKSNRVGSELKAMVRAPDGYAIVGADVDSEELWISSCMGDAQFGLHGATAIGWMTLEGTKKAGTDLHSKTASILGISRDQAKVFNYSRIYGAGMKHAMLLLLQSNASMLPEQAQRLAEHLYASTKGKNTHRTDMFGCKFWFGGTESFVFNKLEEIALSDQPKTPALGCGVTYALSKQYLPEKFGSDYLPSRINWVVQSSGVDYLHLLIVSMEYLLQTYGIQARYLISVHDELRYLVKEEDKYRAALALQIANLWTRSLFAYRLGMDDLPQGVAFFSAVDVDTVLRKEVDMPCVTPSQPVPIPPGESLDIISVLQKTNGGSLWKNGNPMETEVAQPITAEQPLHNYVAPDCLVHRAKSADWLKAQATPLFEEVKFLAEKTAGKKFDGGIGWKKERKMPVSKSGRKLGRPKKLPNVEYVETWDGKVQL